jgi:hypothetical protein
MVLRDTDACENLTVENNNDNPGTCLGKRGERLGTKVLK